MLTGTTRFSQNTRCQPLCTSLKLEVCRGRCIEGFPRCSVLFDMVTGTANRAHVFSPWSCAMRPLDARTSIVVWMELLYRDSAEFVDVVSIAR